MSACPVGLGSGGGVCCELALVSRASHGPRASRPHPCEDPAVAAREPRVFVSPTWTDGRAQPGHRGPSEAAMSLRGETPAVREPSEVTGGRPEVCGIWTWTWKVAWVQLCLFKRGRDDSLSGSRSPAGRHVRGYSRMLWVCLFTPPPLREIKRAQLGAGDGLSAAASAPVNPCLPSCGARLWRRTEPRRSRALP